MAPRSRQSTTSPAIRKARKLNPDAYDFTVVIIVLILVLFGVVMVYSASYYYTMTSEDFNYDMFHFLKLQLIWATLGLIAMFFVMHIPYQFWRRIAVWPYLFSCGCLVLVQFVGEVINGQKRWLGIGRFSFQPSEIAKISVILFLAYYISSNKDCLKDIKGFVRCMLILLVPTALVAISNFSTAIVVMAVGCTVIFIASPKIWYFVAAALPVGLAAVFAVTYEPLRYRLDRVKIWLDPFSDPTGDGYQTIQSLFAIASGGLFGLGLGQSRQKTFIPEAYNDIIFAIICEELGLVGAVLVIALFAILIWRGIRIALRAQDMFASLVAAGITAVIAFQSIINIAVVTNTIPNTGQPLPFVSYGGTSLIIAMGMMGILLNISRHEKRSD